MYVIDFKCALNFGEEQGIDDDLRAIRAIPAERQEPANPFCIARGKVPLGQPMCSITDSSNSLILFQAIAGWRIEEW
jgi:hypothetical protein